MTPSTPPRVWMAVLARATHPDDRPWVVADARDEYDRRTALEGPAAANRWLRRQAMSAIRPGLTERWRRRGRGERRNGSQPAVRTLLDDLLRDGIHAARSLRRSPALVALVVGSLGVGVGGTTLVFSMARSLLFPDPGPIQHPERVVTIYESSPEGEPYRQVAYPNYLDMARSLPAVDQLAASRVGVVRRSGEAGAGAGESLLVELVTGNYFDVLGVDAARGRTFAPDETRLGAALPRIVLSHDYWRREFAGDPDIVGRSLALSGRTYTVIGVAPPGVASRLLQMKVAAWIPLGIPGGTYNATPDELGNREDREYLVLGRLANGATLAHVDAQLTVLADGLRERFPGIWTDDYGEARRFTVLSEADSRLPPDFRTAGALLFGLMLLGTALILAIACSNVAGLLLARAQRRAAEMAIRVSIGAGRGRIIRMLLTESFLLAALGGALGVALSWLLIVRGPSIPLPGTLPDLAFQMRVDRSVLGFSILVSTGCSLLFGLAPALQAARSEGALSNGMRGGSRRSRGRRALVSLQVAGSALFLVAAGLLTRSIDASVTLDSGLRVNEVAVVNWARTEEERGAGWLPAFRDELMGQPEITEVAWASAVEVSPFWDMTLAVASLPGFETTQVVPYNAISPNYVSMVDLQLRRGRWIDASDRAGTMPSVVVNERFVELYLPKGDPLGATFTIEEQRAISTPLDAPPITVQVVGVAADVRNTPLEASAPYFWASIEHMPVPNLFVHARGTSAGATTLALQRLVGERVTLVGPSSYRDISATNTLGQRAVARFLSGGALFALSLAVVGLGGLLSVTVAMRLQELSIRRALGATGRDVVAEVMRESGTLAASGLGLGLGLAIPAAFLARSVLPGVSPLDPLTLLGTVALLLACALLTAVPSALRALRADPLHHLRGE